MFALPSLRKKNPSKEERNSIAELKQFITFALAFAKLQWSKVHFKKETTFFAKLK
jgi:hypothetical protein